MDPGIRDRILRRGIHISSAGLLSYYLVPPDMWGLGPGRELLVLTFLVPVLAFEAWALLAMFVALAAEAPKIAWVDDDFRMLVVPLVALVLQDICYPLPS